MRWTSQSQLDDLDFADDLALLSHTQQQMQEKTIIMTEHSAGLGLNVHITKSKILKVNSTSTVSLTLCMETIEEAE